LSSSKTREEPCPRLLTSLHRTYLLPLSYTYQKDEEITVFPICSREKPEVALVQALFSGKMTYKIMHHPLTKIWQILQDNKFINVH